MNDYGTAWSTLAEAIGAAEGKASGSITDLEHLAIDQRIAAAKVAALLSISQELSGIREILDAGEREE